MSIIGITMGDPAGVGPEIIMKALAQEQVYEHQYVVYGAADILEYYNGMLNLGLKIVDIQETEDYVEHAVNGSESQRFPCVHRKGVHPCGELPCSEEQ